MAFDTESIPEQLHTLRDYLRWGISLFECEQLYFGHGTDNALDEALYLLCYAVHLPLDQAQTFLDARLTSEEKRAVVELFRRRVAERKPAAYLTGEAWFCGLRFNVDERVLVPRSPIAELIENGFEPWLGGGEVHRLLDLCTGSGCIGIACAHAFEEAEVVLADISSDALAVAEQNIRAHDLDDRVTAVHSDVFDGLGEQRFDLIVSNPPYVDAEDYAAMPKEYRAEPALGLASGDDGLDVTRRILAGAAERLNDGGLLVVEVGNSWVALEEAFPQLPFTWVEFEHGGHGVFVMHKEDLLAAASN